jgi:hypothetical protein
MKGLNTRIVGGEGVILVGVRVEVLGEIPEEIKVAVDIDADLLGVACR